MKVWPTTNCVKQRVSAESTRNASMGRTAVTALVLGWLSLVSSDSAILISEPQDFDEVS